MIRAYLFALDPTETQAGAMRSHCGAVRVAYNWCLAQVKANWAQRATEESYGISEAERTPWINTSAYSLRRAWNTAKDLAVLSTGETIPNPRHLDTAQKRLRRAQRVCVRRRGPDRHTRTEPSNRWRKARARADRIHTRVAGLRRNAHHQLTTRLVREFDVIAIENLHVAGMLRNRRLARRIADAGWAEIRRQLTYKTERAGARLVVADRWFASSKTCSGCGTAKTKLALSERTFVCLACGIVRDRDENAARNLAALAAADTGELRREQPDGTDARPAALAREAVGSPREAPKAQRHHREAVAR